MLLFLAMVIVEGYFDMDMYWIKVCRKPRTAYEGSFTESHLPQLCVSDKHTVCEATESLGLFVTTA